MFQTFGLNHVGFLLQSTTWTLLLSAIALVGGAVGGALIALMRISGNRWVDGIARVYIYVLQGTPLLVTLFIVYFGIAGLGFDLPALAAAAIGFTLYSGAFLGEIWRGALEAVGRGQWEGAFALGLGWWRTMQKIVVPPAVRAALPPTVGFCVQLVKNTALASIVGFIELTRAGQIVSSATFQPLQVYLCVAAIYFAICSTLAYASRRLEQRLATTPA